MFLCCILLKCISLRYSKWITLQINSLFKDLIGDKDNFKEGAEEENLETARVPFYMVLSFNLLAKNSNELLQTSRQV